MRAHFDDKGNVFHTLESQELMYLSSFVAAARGVFPDGYSLLNEIQNIKFSIRKVDLDNLAADLLTISAAVQCLQNLTLTSPNVSEMITELSNRIDAVTDRVNELNPDFGVF